MQLPRLSYTDTMVSSKKPFIWLKLQFWGKQHNAIRKHEIPLNMVMINLTHVKKLTILKNKRTNSVNTFYRIRIAHPPSIPQPYLAILIGYHQDVAIVTPFPKFASIYWWLCHCLRLLVLWSITGNGTVLILLVTLEAPRKQTLASLFALSRIWKLLNYALR